jgi:hypothetical protein
MSYEPPPREDIDDYFEKCRPNYVPSTQPPPDLTMEFVLETIRAIPTIELPPNIELFHANKHRHWRFKDNELDWRRAHSTKQKKCAQGFWLSMDPVASIGEKYRKSGPLSKFEVTSPLRLLDLTKNVAERRVAWKKLVDAIDPNADPNAPWDDLVEYNASTYGKVEAEKTFGRLMGAKHRAYPDYYHWFWMALDLLKLDGYVSYDPVDARAHAYAGDVSEAMRRGVFPPIVHRAESAHEVWGLANARQDPSHRISYAFPEFGLGWRGVEKIRFVCDDLVDGCL